MLLDVTVVLLTSGLLGQVPEAVGAPVHSVVVTASSAQSVASDASAVSGSGPSPSDVPADLAVHEETGRSASVRPVSAARLPSLRGPALLDQLSVQPRSAISALVKEHPTSVAALLAHEPAAREVTSWWGDLGDTRQRMLERTAPQLVGNLDGIPFSARDAANRATLARAIEQTRAQLRRAGRAETADLAHRLAALEAVRSALGSSRAVPRRELVELEVSESPKAAIAIGDPQTADYVSVLVPGMFFGVSEQMDAWTDTAARLYDEEVSWLRLFEHAAPSTAASATTAVASSTSASADAAARVATIAWIGYQTPHLLNVGSDVLAEQGRDSLTGLVEGLQASRTGDEPFVSVVAHSYGTTAALMALSEEHFEVDALVLVGSPGGPASSARDLHVRDGNVFVGEASWDPIPNSSYFGTDPGTPAFGARRMSVAGGVDAITDETLAASVGHNDYFGAGTESLRNMALIGIDRPQFVTDGTAKDRGRTLALLH